MNTKLKGRLLSLALCVMVAAASCLPAFAAGQTIVVKECDNLTLTLPEDMTAVTRSSEPDDSYFSIHEVSYDEVQDAFEAGDSYLQAMDSKNELTLTLSYFQTGAKDFGDMSAEEFNQLARGFIGGTDPDVQYMSSTQDEVGHEMVWLFLTMSIGDGSSKGSTQYQATTVIKGMNVTLTLYRNGGSVLPEDYEVLESVARTVKPPDVFPLRRFLPYVLIGVGLAALVLIIILIIKNIKKSREARDAKSENDKILEELAIMYQQKRATQSRHGKGDAKSDKSQKDGGAAYEDIFANSASNAKDAAEPETAPAPKEQEPVARKQTPAKKAEQAPAKKAPAKKRVDVDALLKEEFGDEFSESASTSYDDDIPRKYSDEDIERLLS